jgi:predicted CXXCH cytochrome family protein
MALLLHGFSALSQAADNPFHLKEGGRGKICLNCHDAFQDILKSPFVHTPVKTWNCAGCHNPHTSSHGKMLDADPKAICLRCHAKLLPEKPVSLHKVVADGNCVACHDPHAAPNKFNLHKSGSALCFECHKEMGTRLQGNKFKHPPVEQSCTSCHDPHVSAKGEKLLRDGMPALCLKCHDPGKSAFQKQHMNYPVEKANCTSCHNPHGSNQKGLFYDKVHSPFAKRSCSQCHEGPTSQAPFKVKAQGSELCRGCHSGMLNEALSKNRLHWPLLDRTGCLNCHTPHASDQAGLLKAPMLVVCGKCHADCVDRIRTYQSKHPPVAQGECTGCHSPHSSDQLLLLNKPSVIEVCGSCHDWQQHSTHPIGTNAKDPRNPNLFVTCTSCHRSHGTDNKKMLLAPTQTEMCTNCHKQYGR